MGEVVLLVGGLVVRNVRSFGWMISEKVNHDTSMIKNHGLGLSCGISLRRGRFLFLQLKRLMLVHSFLMVMRIVWMISSRSGQVG